MDTPELLRYHSLAQHYADMAHRHLSVDGTTLSQMGYGLANTYAMLSLALSKIVENERVLRG